MELNRAAAAAHVIIDKGEAEIEDFTKRTRRSIAPFSFIRENADQPLDELGSASDAEEAAPRQKLSSAQAKSSKKNKGKGKEAARGVIQEAATAIDDRSIFDNDPPSSPPPLGKRDRRDSNSKWRKKRKSRSNVSLDDRLDVGATDELLNQSASDHADQDPRPDDIAAAKQEDESGSPGTTHSRFAVLDEYQFDDGASPDPSRASVTGSQRSRSGSGYVEPDRQGPLTLKPGMGMDDTNGSPRSEDDHHSTTGDKASEDGDDRMSVISVPDDSPVASDSDDHIDVTARPHSPEDSPVVSDTDSDAETSAPLPRNRESASPTLNSSAKSSRHSAKRQAKLPFFPRQEEEKVQAFAELPHGDAASPPRLRRSNRRRSAPQVQADVAPEDSEEQINMGESQYRTGPLSSAEQDQITRTVERFREDEDLTQEEINQVIHDNPQTSNRPIHRQLWATVQDACPFRTRRKLISWCRQHFHNWAGRGTWTQAQDDELADLIEAHGKKWSHIAGLINRYPGDVRDRWRNYLVCRETVKTDVWSEGEEERFRELVENSIDMIRQKIGEHSRKAPEELLNWLNISEAMGHTRSRLQCIQKWKRMCEAAPLADSVPTVLPSGSSWRLDKARDQLRRITADDKYRLMCAVRDLGVGTDTKINWKQIVNGTFRNRYERQALVVTWGRLRKAVPDWEWKTTRDCARHLCEMYESEGNFGTIDESEVENGTAASTNKRQKGKKRTRRLAPADDLAPESQDQPLADSEPDDDVEMEHSMHIESHAKSTNNRSHHVEKEQSSELDSVSRESSPSVEAQAARTKRWGGRESTAEDTGAPEKSKELSSPGPKAASVKLAKRARRDSFPNGGVEDLRSKKRKTTGSRAKAKANGVSKKTNGKSWSVVSSDMEDMEDIPATLP